MNFIRYSLLIILLTTKALFAFPIIGGGTTSENDDGSQTSPYQLVIDGDKRDNDDPTKYYKFTSLVNQKVTVHITDHDENTESCLPYGGCSTIKHEVELKLHPLNDDQSCNTDVILSSNPSEDGEFTWDVDVNAMNSYCLEVIDDSSIGASNTYDIQLTGDAPLEAGISDASANESNGPLEFTVALTKASNEDVTINYTFTDNTAHAGVNYDGTNGSVTIPKGALSTTISVPLTDTHMDTTKDFTITISSSDLDISAQSSQATGTIYGSQASSADGDYNGPDICYDSRETSGFCMFGSCFMYKEQTRVHAMVNGLDDVDVKKALTRGIAFMDFGSEIGTNDEQRTLDSGDDEAEKRSFANADFMGFYNASMFPNGAEYRLGDGADATHGGSMDKDDRSSYYDQSMFKLGLFTDYTTLVTYTKNGIRYQEVLQACNPDSYGSLDSKPVLNDCGIFLGALNSQNKIKFTSSAWQTIHYQTDLATPVIEGSTGYCSASSQTCTANGIGIGVMPLPTFRNSQVNTITHIPYSMVIAQQHVGSLVVDNDQNTQSDEDNRTIVFEAPYSSSYGGRVMFIKSILDHDDHAQMYHYVFKEGDYWIGDVEISKDHPVTIETVGNVRFFINENFLISSSSGEVRIGYHPAVEEESSCQDPHFYLYVAHDITLRTQGSGHIKNGYIYAKGAVTIEGGGAFASYYSAITADGSIEIATAGSGSFSASDASGTCKDPNAQTLFAQCVGSGGASGEVTGPFNAWDTDSDILSRIIKTKITAQSFSLVIASMNKDDNATETKEGIDMQYRLYDVNNSVAVTAWQEYNATTGADGASATKLFDTVTTAHRDVQVQFKFCATHTESGEMQLHPLLFCTNNGIETNTTTFSRDHFAIRPYALAVFGKNQYKRAGEDFNLTIKAVTQADASKLLNSSYANQNDTVVHGIAGYDNTLNNLNINVQFYQPSASELNQMRSDTGATIVSNCPNAGVFSLMNGTENFHTGEINASLRFSETGILDVNISEIVGQEWAKIDTNDTSVTQRLIQPSTITCDISDISRNILMLFVPYKFDTNATYTTNTTHNWLYMHDINSSHTTLTTPQHSAYISYTIVAKNKAGNITRNYTRECFPDTKTTAPRVNGLKLNTTFDLFLDANINISQNADMTLYTEDQYGNAVWTITKKYTFAQGNNAIREWISPMQFLNGQGQAKVYFSIDRNSSVARNPITVRVDDANTSTSWMSNPGSPKQFNGQALNQNKIFYYGRVHAPRTKIIGAQGNANLYFEIYCNGATCNKAQLPNGANAKITDDPRWFINSAHTVPTDGSASSVLQKNSTGHITATTPTIATPSQTTLQYDESRGYPYKSTMLINASSWLIYNKYNASKTTNEFEVEFSNGTQNWAGKAETNSTTNNNASSSTTRRLMW